MNGRRYTAKFRGGRVTDGSADTGAGETAPAIGTAFQPLPTTALILPLAGVPVGLIVIRNSEPPPARVYYKSCFGVEFGSQSIAPVVSAELAWRREIKLL